MAWLFSKRCQDALREKRITVSIPLRIRNRIWKLLCEYNWSWPEEGSWTSAKEQLVWRIKAEHGLDDLMAFPEDEGSPGPGDLEDFVLRGYYPPHLLDALELYYELVETAPLFQRKLNEIMEESKLPWRMAEGKIFPVDSTYIEEEILRMSYELLHQMKFQGALEEFQKARIALSNTDSGAAIHNANLAFESVAKEILGTDKAKPGELYRGLIDSGIIPEYYEGFLKTFEKDILRCVAIMRNQEPSAGHGKGASDRSVPASLAELGVYLSAVLINFVIKHYLESQSGNPADYPDSQNN